jgi:hypothetical protein
LLHFIHKEQQHTNKFSDRLCVFVGDYFRKTSKKYYRIKQVPHPFNGNIESIEQNKKSNPQLISPNKEGIIPLSQPQKTSPKPVAPP